MAYTITSTELQSIVPSLKGEKLNSCVYGLNESFAYLDTDNPICVAMYIAQIAHESGGFIYVKELASGIAYEGRKDLGNTSPGDGVKYKGRGWIQITGKNNYKELSTAFNTDFVSNPILLEQFPWYAKSAAWFWNSRNLTKIAELGTEEAFIKVTKRINGGTNGLEDRKKYWGRAKVALNI